MLYGKNVFDKVTPQGAFDIPLASGSHAQYVLPGAVWGATLIQEVYGAQHLTIASNLY